MKRVGYLYEKMCDVDFIKKAIKNAAKGKTDRLYVKAILSDIGGYAQKLKAMSLLSLIGWLSHINGRNFYKKNIYPYAPKNKLKKIVSNYSKQNGGNLKNGKRKTKSIQQRQMARNGKRGQGGGDTHSTRN